MSAFGTIQFEKTGAVAMITLNRPEVINAYSLEMRDELWEVLGACEDDPDVRAVVLQGAGQRGFCAGADLNEFGTAPSPSAARRVRWQRDVFGRLYALPKPVVAALHGHVIGSGVELALLCDLRVARTDAVFSMPETRFGLIPAAGGTQTVPRMLGESRGLGWLLTGRPIDAQEAARIGLVQRVVTAEGFGRAVAEIAQGLAQLDPLVVAAIKRAWRSALDQPEILGLREEARLARRIRMARQGA